MLNHTIYCSLICICIYLSCKEGMILHKPSTWLRLWLMELPSTAFFIKPLFGCLTCMCSFWGGAYYLINFEYFSIYQMFTFILITGGLNGIVDTWIGYIELSKLMKHIEDQQ